MTATPEERAVIEAARKWSGMVAAPDAPALRARGASPETIDLVAAVKALDRSAKRAEAERRAREIVDRLNAQSLEINHGMHPQRPTLYVMHVHAAIVDLLMGREG